MEIKDYKKNTDKLVAAVSDLSIASADDYQQGAMLRGVIKQRYKKIDEARKLMTEPHRKKTAEINAMFKEQLDPLDSLLNTLDHAMLKYKKEEQAAAKAEAERAKEDERAPIVAPERTTRTSTGTTSVKKIWKGEVINRGLVWRKYPEFFIVDQVQVDKMARIIQAETEVDGVRIYFEETLSTRT